MVEQTEQNAQVAVAETIGDCAYGDGATRQAFADAGRPLVAKVPDRKQIGYFAKEAFRIDLATMTCTCPAGQTCQRVVRKGGYRDRDGNPLPFKAFHFAPAVCAACPLRAACVKTGPGKGRTVTVHPQEALLQAARAFQKSEGFAPYRKWRQVAEHRLARLMQLGVRQARSFGRAKTRCQLLLAATVANLTLVATKLGLMRTRGSRKAHLFAPFLAPLTAFMGAFTLLLTNGFGPNPSRLPPMPGCRPGF